jgi:hypothetical protein
MNIDIADVKDTLISIYCYGHCPEYADDYSCPDHTCLVWKLLEHLNSEVSK